MNKIRFLALGVALSVGGILISSPSRADYSDSGVWIISAGTSVGVNYQSGNNNGTTWSLMAGIGHSVGSDFELIVFGSYNSTAISGLPTTSTSSLEGQLDYVITGMHNDALYLGAKGGAAFVDTSNGTSSTPVFGGVIGKRFMIAPSVSYDPNLSVMFSDNSGNIGSADFIFFPVQFTFIF